jgi:hypothetical protein
MSNTTGTGAALNIATNTTPPVSTTPLAQPAGTTTAVPSAPLSLVRAVVAPVLKVFRAANAAPSAPGRPKNSNTGRAQLVDVILTATAKELGVPTQWIKKYDAAKWSLCMSKLTSSAVSKIMKEIAGTGPHPAYGTPSQIPVADRVRCATWIDAEGCICIFPTKKGLRCVLSVGQSNIKVPTYLHGTLGAHAYVHGKKLNIGQNKKPYTYDVASAPHVIHALCAVYPELMVKQNQAEALFRFFIEGRQWQMGPGTPPAVKQRRRYWCLRLKRMK